MTFFVETSPFPYSESGMSRMVPLIVGALKNPEAAIWELDAALFAISVAPPKEIVKNFDLIAPFLKHDEWWVRTGAFLAICNTGADAAPVVPDLIECFVREEHGWPREFYHRKLKPLLREDKPKLTDKTREQVMELLGDDIVGGNYPRDHAYMMRGNFFYEHRNSHVLLSFEPDELALVADQVNQTLANFGDPELARGKAGNTVLMILNGDKWGGPGLLNIMAKMDENDRAKLMPGLKALLAGGLDIMCDNKSKATKTDPNLLKEVKDKAQTMLDEHEKRHSKVRPYPARKIDYERG